MAQANNQEGIGIALGRIGANFYLGPAEFVADDELHTALSVLLANEPARQAMALAAAAVCDGHGSRRVKGRLLQLSFTIKRVTLADAEMLYSWRNDERTRRYSADPRPLTLIQHLAWINRTLSMAEVDLLLACCEEEPVTCLRFDRSGSKALVSIYTNPDNHGKGLNVGVLLTAIDWLRTNHPEIDATEAEVLAGNDASHTLFVAAGFHPIATRYMRKQ
jgi:RimJ/RimL family protein N-acetyltransferase